MTLWGSYRWQDFNCRLKRLMRPDTVDYRAESIYRLVKDLVPGSSLSYSLEYSIKDWYRSLSGLTDGIPSWLAHLAVVLSTSSNRKICAICDV